MWKKEPSEKRNLPMIFGPLLLAVAIGLGELGLPHAIKLALLVLSIAIDLWGLAITCREKQR